MKFDKQRRQLMLGMSGVAAAGLVSPVLASVTSTPGTGVLTGEVTSTIYKPHKILTLRNASNNAIVIDQFERKAMTFDGEIVDCNAACLENKIVVPANGEVRVHFDKRKLFNSDRSAHEYLNVQARVVRMTQGSRVVAINLTVVDGIATVA